MASLEEVYGSSNNIGNKCLPLPEKIYFDDITIDLSYLIDSYPSSYFCNGKALGVRELYKKLSDKGYNLYGNSKNMSAEQYNFLNHIKKEIDEADKFEEELD